MQRIKSAALDTSPTVAELVELQRLGILSKAEVREIILRPTTPSPSNDKTPSPSNNKKFLAQRQIFDVDAHQRNKVQRLDAPVSKAHQKRDTSV